MIASIPTPAPGSVESWLWAFAAVLWIALLVKRLFVRQPPIEAEFVTKKDFVEHQAACHPRFAHLERDYAPRSEIHTIQSRMDRLEAALHTNREALLTRMDEMKSELIVRGERDRKAIHERLNDILVQVTRVDERTRP